MLAVLTLALLAQCSPEGPIYSCPSRMAGAGGAPAALFEFAPLSGAGMPAACVCGFGPAPTGSKGEVLTFTRASTAWCTKGNETSGIVAGDLVQCASGQPRVMPGGDGTGGLGLAVWEARTNYTLRSQEFEDVTWAASFSGAASRTITANAGVAPDGTTTADRLQVPATVGATYSIITQGNGCPSGVVSQSVYVKGYGGTSGTIDVSTYDGTGTCTPCAYSGATWTKCSRPNKTMAASAAFQIGSAAVWGAPCLGAAADVLVWQSDCQPGAAVGPPITTAGTAATRVLEVPTFVSSPPVGTGATAGSAAATLIAVTSNATVLTFSTASGRPMYYAGGQVRFYDGANITGVAATLSGASAVRLATSWTGSVATAFNVTATTSATGVFDGAVIVVSPLEVGYSAALGAINGVIKQVCLDADPTRCR